ncbi:MAG: hypothetical protein IIT65_01260 [Lachnospiraceae bacterium]|nr:hypothetical protein [Lachnospiraceae bacterium]
MDKIEYINVENKTYQVSDPSTPDYVKDISQAEINKWNQPDYEDETNKPSINGVTLSGNKTSDDLGLVADKTYLHHQTVASDTWVIVHNLNKYPSVAVIDSAGNEVIGEISYDDKNQVTLKFEGGFKGVATLN